MAQVAEMLKLLGKVPICDGFVKRILADLSMDSREYTAFATPLGLCQFMRMPFATFQWQEGNRKPCFSMANHAWEMG